MDFEWDEEKRRANLAKHGVDFALAAKIFREDHVEGQDLRGSRGEIRFLAVGQADRQAYVVAFTWRGETRRIISAWKIGEKEQEKISGATHGPISTR